MYSIKYCATLNLMYRNDVSFQFQTLIFNYLNNLEQFYNNI